MTATTVLKRLRNNEKGFTLIELLAVIVILGVIAAIAVPLIGNMIDNTKDDADRMTALQVYEAARLYITAEGNMDFKSKTVTTHDSSTTAKDGLISKGYLDAINLPSTKKPVTAGTVTFNADGKLESVSLTSDGTDYDYTAADLKQ